MSEIKEYWEEMHKKNDKGMLTGTHLGELIDTMNIKDKLQKGSNILNIGIGMGYCTQELVDLKLNVDVLDISETAINRVIGITQNRFLTSQIEKIPKEKYDLAISHLVSQHMNDDDLTKQMKYVISSLKNTGIFALQFAFVKNPDNAIDFTSLQKLSSQMGGGVLRQLEDIEILANNNNGYLNWISNERTFENTPARWQYVHIKRNIND